MGLGCLLSLCVAGRASADGTTGQGAAQDARPAPLRVPGAITGEPARNVRTLIPPFMRDTQGSIRTTALFPFYFDRRDRALHERFVLPYFYRRSPQLNTDVALGLAWSLRGPDRNTFVLPPLYTHRNGDNWGFGLLPLFSTGVFKGHHHTLIPPLLTWIDGDAKKRRTVAALYFDFRADQSRFWGLFPLLWSKRDEVDRFTVIPPLFFRFADDDPLSTTTVVPPFYHKRRKDKTSWGLAPLAFGSRSPELRSLTLPFLLFHHATGPREFQLITPLIAHLRDDKDGSRWFTLLYQRKRGDRGYDAVAPLFFRTWDTRDMSRGLFVPPLYWHWRDPANDALAILPFVVRTHHDGISNTWVTPLIGRYRSFERDKQTWWVAPTFHYGWDESAWQFNIHPIFYLKRAADSRHLAIAPLWFDFHNRTKQTHRFTLLPLYWNFKNFDKQTYRRALFPLYWDFENGKKEQRRLVGFPLYWDFQQGPNRRTSYAFPLYLRLQRGTMLGHSVLNTYFERRDDPGNRRWQFHFFPLGAFGGGEKQRFWSFLYGLAGYERRGEYRRMKLFWIPFRLR